MYIILYNFTILPSSNLNMGIKHLHKFLKKHAPAIYKEQHLSTFEHKRIAVDINLYLYYYKSRHKQKWMSAFYNMICTLRQYDIQMIFIYDFKAPIEKESKQQERKMRRRNAENKITEIKEAYKLFTESEDVSPLITSVIDKRGHPMRKLLSPDTSPVYDKETVALAVNEEIRCLENQIVNVSRYDIENSKKLLDVLHIAYYTSENEAETLCSYMCNHKYVDAVLSNDTDVLVYGTPIFMTRLNVSRETCTFISFKDVLQTLNLTFAEFVDFCILCGTDYNRNIFRVGSEKAINLIRQYHSIEGIDQHTSIDVSILNHVRVREIFKVPDSNEHERSCYFDDSVPDLNEFREFAVVHHLHFNEDRFMSVFVPSETSKLGANVSETV